MDYFINGISERIFWTSRGAVYNVSSSISPSYGERRKKFFCKKLFDAVEELQSAQFENDMWKNGPIPPKILLAYS